MAFTHHHNLTNIFFNSLDKALDVYCNYEKVVLVGDFNAKIGETCLDNFLFQHEQQSINKEPTCFKNAYNPVCIDFILTNSQGRFLVISVFKITFSNSIYRDFKKFSEETFSQELSLKLTDK